MLIIDHYETGVQCKWQNRVQNIAKQKSLVHNSTSPGIAQEFFMGIY